VRIADLDLMVGAQTDESATGLNKRNKVQSCKVFPFHRNWQGKGDDAKQLSARNTCSSQTEHSLSRTRSTPLGLLERVLWTRPQEHHLLLLLLPQQGTARTL
jgi:hypothetical protein